MNKNFSPGPWKRIKYKNGDYGFKIITDKGSWSERVADVSEIYMDRGRRHANARLIEAAPEMFELLEKLLSGPVLDAESSRKVDQLLTRITTP